MWGFSCSVAPKDFGDNGQDSVNRTISGRFVVSGFPRAGEHEKQETLTWFGCAGSRPAIGVFSDAVRVSRGEKRMRKRKMVKPVLYALVLSVAFVCQIPIVSADGIERTEPAQDENGTYLIGTPGELAWFDYESTMVSVDRAVEMSRASVRLTADIDMTGYEWLVISAKESSGYPTPGHKYYSGGSYRGTFDGAGHVIRGLTIERENTYIAFEPQNRIDCVGLFGYLHSAVIRDLGVEGTIHVLDRSESSWADYFHAGAIGGLVQKSRITGCYANVAISITNDPENPGQKSCDNYIGGIAGGISGGSVIENCYSRGSIYSECTRCVSAGGIVGATRNASKEYDSAGNYIVPNNNTVTKCWSDMDVRINPEKMGCAKKECYVGGIIGQVGATSDVVPIVSYCYALNRTLDGGVDPESQKSYAARVVGSGKLFELSGMYNFGLDAMTIRNATISSYDSDDVGYHNIWGKDISETKAKAPADEYGYNEFLLNAWNFAGDTAEPENVWCFDDENSYPLFVWQAAAGSGDEPVTGDADGNGTVDQNDVKLLQKAALGKLRPIPDSLMKACDFNGDGKITASDVLRAKRLAAGTV